MQNWMYSTSQARVQYGSGMHVNLGTISIAYIRMYITSIKTDIINAFRSACHRWMWFPSLASTLFAKHPARCTIHSTDLYSPKHGSVTSVSLTLPVPVLQVHILGVPPAEVLLVGQAAHTPEVGSTYSFTSQTAWRIMRSIDSTYFTL